MGIFFVSEAAGRELALTGPSDKLDAAHWPARGDLAHIRLAGRVFVPHYAEPLAFTVVDQAELRAAPRADADLRDTLTPGIPFNVLDIAGKWAWGQVGEDGCVGYVPLGALARDAN
ncbi:SH3 domain-containing protein [Qipengyuania sediminis]|uniref:SH3 domain-containing protein n=1 Tax=Qipengyuania sediminis TaxID=1532023 RepID=UPI0010592561|nr:SH3 domain-containing protein [Qipengyuania sediminis]